MEVNLLSVRQNKNEIFEIRMIQNQIPPMVLTVATTTELLKHSKFFALLRQTTNATITMRSK